MKKIILITLLLSGLTFAEGWQYCRVHYFWDTFKGVFRVSSYGTEHKISEKRVGADEWDKTIDKLMADLGKKGWELVTVGIFTPNARIQMNGATLYFKRRINE